MVRAHTARQTLHFHGLLPSIAGLGLFEGTYHVIDCFTVLECLYCSIHEL
jgi:hypothetical protein